MVISMKKIIPILGLVAGAAALVAYKMKKDEQKQIVDLDQGLLNDEDETIEEGPINPQACCEEAEESFEEMVDTAEQKVKNLKERTEELLDKAEDKAQEAGHAFKVKLEDACEATEHFVEDAKDKVEDAVEHIKDSNYPHLSSTLLDAILAKADEVIAKLEIDGDIHKHERPVQHKIVFSDEQDLEAFKHEVINKGFVITNGEAEHELMVLHITSINKEKLYDNMKYLADAAAAHHGSYEGWTSKVVY